MNLFLLCGLLFSIFAKGMERESQTLPTLLNLCITNLSKTLIKRTNARTLDEIFALVTTIKKLPIEVKYPIKDLLLQTKIPCSYLKIKSSPVTHSAYARNNENMVIAWCDIINPQSFSIRTGKNPHQTISNCSGVDSIYISRFAPCGDSILFCEFKFYPMGY